MSKSPIVVLDTNIIVSALISPYGPPGKIWDLVTSDKIILAYDDRILIEYEEVLRRPKFKFPHDQVYHVLSIFTLHHYVSAQSLDLNSLPDKSDKAFVEVAHTANCPLVTGNLKHYPKHLCHGVTILSPALWLQSLSL